MRWTLLLANLIAFASFTTVSQVALHAEPMMCVGVAETDITPPENYPLSGYYHERLATGTIDPLKAHAMMLRSGSQRVVLVTCDLTGIATDLTAHVRRRAAAKTGLRPEQIVLTASHSHTAPDYFKDLFLWSHNPDKAPARARYVETLIDRIVEAIAQANQNCQFARLSVGSTPQETPVSFNRRFLMRDGSVRTWMNLANPEVLRAAGPIDPEVGIVVARSKDDNKPLAVLSNFALHLDTVGGNRWSADYPFFIERAVREKLGSNVISLFGTGCCGDINHSDPARKDRNKTDFIGTELGKTIVAGLDKLQPVASTTLDVRTTIVRVPLQDVKPEELTRAKEILTTVQQGQSVEFLTQVLAYKQVVVDQLRQRRDPVESAKWGGWGMSQAWGGIGTELPLEVTTITVGSDLAIVCLPGEVFVDLGLAIKRHSPFRTTLVIELCGCVETVYIPTRTAYAGGSYEVTNSALLPGSGEMLVEAALRSLRESATDLATSK